MNFRCSISNRNERNARFLKSDPLSISTPIGWDYILTDMSDSKPLLYIFRHVPLTQAIQYKKSNPIPPGVRIIHVSIEILSIEQQIEANSNQVEVWFDNGDWRLFYEQVEYVSNSIPQRVRQDDLDAIDIEMVHLLKGVVSSSNCNVIPLLTESRTFQKICNLPNETRTKLTGNEDINVFFSQVL